MGNSNNKFNMENSDVDSLATGINNMNIDDIQPEPWITAMSAKELQATIREVASIDNYGEIYPGGYILQPMEVVTEDNRHIYEKNLAIFLSYELPEEVINHNDIMNNMTVKQLVEVCKENGISNYSGKNKAQLQEMIIDKLNL